jgi:hypothetical protein
MPIETVDIAFSQPEPGTASVPFANPKLKEYTLPDGKKIMMIVFNTRLDDMTMADLQQYRQWIARLPAMMGPYMYHPDFINAVCEQATNLAETVKTRLYAAAPKSPDLHE